MKSKKMAGCCKITCKFTSEILGREQAFAKGLEEIARVGKTQSESVSIHWCVSSLACNMPINVHFIDVLQTRKVCADGCPKGATGKPNKNDAYP
ncbi:hypothetical protein JWJ90_06385 [Desulfobulbus rhabdoformis]|uniref:hypothetical protein n=1 Tax=Desulfobulbus rhabdoformis TaxID=34032 RepID=UPI00196448EE|nr:hypothetical protein [Desulfobulbus rhabdoformis]MBM9613916.1 hypothetical protein [Desulfobulbus rhabdoformis]